MSAMFDRLQRVFEDGHGAERPVTRIFAPVPIPERIRQAAVIVAITDREEPGVLLTHRPKTMRDHAGQVAFPGGKIDRGEDAPRAAIRELHEELGVDPGIVRIVGASDSIVTGTGFEITPVVGVIPSQVEITPDPTEVADWFEAPLRYILDPGNHLLREAEFKGVRKHNTEIHWEGHRIWGATAAIIRNLSLRLEWRELVGG